MSGVNFTPAAAERIIAATRKVERTPTSIVGERRNTPPGEIAFWAWLSSGGGLNGLFWSWVKVEPAAELPTASDPWTMEDPPLFVLSTPHVAGYQNARESSNNRNVAPESIVRLHFIGYGKDGEPQYIFQAPPQATEGAGTPLHDHRDNVTGGGFAFATYHPGTSLPQQPWAI